VYAWNDQDWEQEDRRICCGCVSEAFLSGLVCTARHCNVLVLWKFGTMRHDRGTG